MSSGVFWVVFEGSARIFRLVASVLLFIFHLIPQWIGKACPPRCVCSCGGYQKDSRALLLVSQHFLHRAMILLTKHLQFSCGWLLYGRVLMKQKDFWEMFGSSPGEGMQAIRICGQHPVGPRSALLVLKPVKLSRNEMAQPMLKKSAETNTIDALNPGPTVWPAESSFISIGHFHSSCFPISMSN